MQSVWITLYFNFRKANSTGYPLAVNSLFDKLGSVGDRNVYENELKRRLLVLVQRAIAMKHLLVEDAKPSSSDGEDVRKRALFPSEKYTDELYVGQKEVAESSEAKGAAKSLTVLIVFDEARGCLETVEKIGVSKFRMICKALRSLSTDPETKMYNVVSVFIDISSKIRNFSSAVDDDASARQWLTQRKTSVDCGHLQLFHPFILYCTFDLYLTRLDFTSLAKNASMYDYVSHGGTSASCAGILRGSKYISEAETAWWKRYVV